MKRKISILGAVILISLLCMISCRKAGNWLVKKDTLENADAIVMLTGSIADRVLEVADLFINKKMADKVIIVEVSQIIIRWDCIQ